MFMCIYANIFIIIFNIKLYRYFLKVHAYIMSAEGEKIKT